MNPREQREAAAYIGPARLALGALVIAWGLGLALVLWHGPPGLVGLAALVWLAKLAKPPLPPHIADKLKGPP